MTVTEMTILKVTIALIMNQAHQKGKHLHIRLRVVLLPQSQKFRKAHLQQFVVHLEDSNYQTELDQWYCQLHADSLGANLESALYQQTLYIKQGLQTKNR